LAAGRIERETVARPYDHRLCSALGRALALLGNKEEAVRAAELAVELVPVTSGCLSPRSSPGRPTTGFNPSLPPALS